MRARAASNSASLPRKAKCRGPKSVESEKSRVTPLSVLTGTKWPHSGPASKFRMSARNLAEAHLSFAGMIVWFSSTLILTPSLHTETTIWALRNPHVPENRRVEFEDVPDVLSKGSRQRPFSPRHVWHFAESDLLD